MKTRLHAKATTTPRTRALIQASNEPVAALARRFGVSETTIRRWRGRAGAAGGGGRGEVQDRSHARPRLGQATTPEDEAIIAELRSRAGLSLDDIVEVMNRCVHPGLSRNLVWRAPACASSTPSATPSTLCSPTMAPSSPTASATAPATATPPAPAASTPSAASAPRAASPTG